jgi:hypothetical protein
MFIDIALPGFLHSVRSAMSLEIRLVAEKSFLEVLSALCLL